MFVLFSILRRSLVAVFLITVVSAVPMFATGQGEDGTADQADEESNVVHVYSNRHYDTDQALFDRFEEFSGYEVQVVEAGSDEIIERLAAEGADSPADILITADAGRLHQASTRDLFQSVDSPVLDSLVPDNLKGADDEWFALTRRSRLIVYHNERADESDLSTYEALAGEEFRDNVLIRSSSNIYNISLLASLIEHLGSDAAREWAEGMTENFARPPQGGDTDQLRGVAAGEADYAISNTYYLGRLLGSSDPADVEIGEQLSVYFPNQPGVEGSDGRGAHFNVSGAGITRHADNAKGARELLEFLVSDEAQEQFAQANYEYPIRDDIELAPEIEQFGDFVADDLPLYILGENQREATMIFNEVGWQ
ncbi:MAG: extracellular solute-binding protein [Alkalispirochaeta sp.]